jgi:hypothetical protein
VLRKFPTLKLALSEGGIGWIPYFLDRLDWIYTRHRAWTGQDYGASLPSEVFRSRIVTCFIDDPAGVAALDRMAVDSVCWEADYPHSDSTWPVSPETLWATIAPAGLDDATIDGITHRNAMRHFRYDPFSSAGIDPAGSTVGALRARAGAAGVDVATRSAGERRSSRSTAATYLTQRR